MPSLTKKGGHPFNKNINKPWLSKYKNKRGDKPLLAKGAKSDLLRKK